MTSEEFKPELYYPLVNKLMREDDLNDPLLEQYQKDDAELKLLASKSNPDNSINSTPNVLSLR